MLRNLTGCACALIAVLFLNSDASAFGKRRCCCATTYTDNNVNYVGYGSNVSASGGNAPGYGYYPGYGGYGPGFGYGYNPGGLGGPASGLGVRPGMGLGGFGPGR